jgi:hypothetical protein
MQATAYSAIPSTSLGGLSDIYTPTTFANGPLSSPALPSRPSMSGPPGSAARAMLLL